MRGWGIFSCLPFYFGIESLVVVLLLYVSSSFCEAHSSWFLFLLGCRTIVSSPVSLVPSVVMTFPYYLSTMLYCFLISTHTSIKLVKVFTDPSGLILFLIGTLTDIWILKCYASFSLSTMPIQIF